MLQLKCVAQNYAWGKVGADSFVGRINQTNCPHDDIQGKSFAEYWMGDHVNGPSKIVVDAHDESQQQVINDIEFLKQKHGQEVSIKELFLRDPTKYLGDTYLQKLGQRDPNLNSSLSFLFKVLSVKTALSIQAHPNKELAQKLHEQFPDKYKDPNHKPEIAIALTDDFKACYGFCTAEKVKANLMANPTLAEVFSLGDKEMPNEAYLKESIEKMFLNLNNEENKENLRGIINKINEHIDGLQQSGQRIDGHQELFKLLIQQYGNCDIGLLFIFFLNIIECKKGESFVCSPDEPHCYIQGELIEAMVNSDNVVRGGLTPKYKDTKTLVEMLKYEFQDIKPTSGLQIMPKDNPVQYTHYPTGYTDFMVTHLTISQSDECQFHNQFESVALAFVQSGTCKAQIKGFQDFEMSEMKAYMILPKQQFTLKNTSDNLSIFFCSCDFEAEKPVQVFVPQQIKEKQAEEIVIQPEQMKETKIDVKENSVNIIPAELQSAIQLLVKQQVESQLKEQVAIETKKLQEEVKDLRGQVEDLKLQVFDLQSKQPTSAVAHVMTKDIKPNLRPQLGGKKTLSRLDTGLKVPLTRQLSGTTGESTPKGGSSRSIKGNITLNEKSSAGMKKHQKSGIIQVSQSSQSNSKMALKSPPYKGKINGSSNKASNLSKGLKSNSSAQVAKSTDKDIVDDIYKLPDPIDTSIQKRCKMAGRVTDVVPDRSSKQGKFFFNLRFTGPKIVHSDHAKWANAKELGQLDLNDNLKVNTSEPCEIEAQLSHRLTDEGKVDMNKVTPKDSSKKEEEGVFNLRTKGNSPKLDKQDKSS